MVNTYEKGNRVEKELRDILEERGNMTWKPSRAKFNANDIYGLFDFIAVPTYQIEDAQHGRLVQVKSNDSHFYSARIKVRKWFKTLSPGLACLACCVALKISPGKFRIWQCRYVNRELVEEEGVWEVMRQ